MVPSGLLLAAGASVRFGGAKLLAPVAGEPLVRRSARVLLEGGVADLVVVTGARPDEVAAALDGLGVRVVCNRSWAAGMFSSVRAGLAAILPGEGPVAISPADLPALEAPDVRRLLEEGGRIEADHPGTIVVPSCGGRRGHPLLLPRRAAEAVALWDDSARLDAVLGDGRWGVHHLEGFAPGILRDADTPGDLALLAGTARSRASGVP